MDAPVQSPSAWWVRREQNDKKDGEIGTDKRKREGQLYKPKLGP